MAQASANSLYSRLGGYDTVAAVVDELLAHARTDSRLGRFWNPPRSQESNRRERQRMVDFICNAAGGPTLYLGPDMKTSHTGIGITAEDYAAFKRNLGAALEKCKVPTRETGEVMNMISNLERDIVEK